MRYDFLEAEAFGACMIRIVDIQRGWICAWVLGFLASWAWTQTNEEVFREYQFNFSLPGARANALGGAFIGLSDDATSSFSNPAGLAYLRDPAITVEYRYRSHESQLEELAGNVNFTFEQRPRTSDQISFISFNYQKNGWYWALFRYNYLNEVQQRDFVSRSLSSGRETISAIQVDLELQGHAQGVGLARRFRGFKLGLALAYASLRGKSRYTKEQLEITPDIEERFYTSALDGRDWALSGTLGFLHEPHEAFSWGLVWRKSPRFSLSQHVEETDSGQLSRIADYDVPFVVPDVLGAGLKYKPLNQVTVVLDWQAIFYDQIIKDGFRIVENPESDSRENYTIEKTDEFHLGTEWLLPLRDNVLAIRAGFFRNPTHLVRYIGDDPIQASLFSRRGLHDEEHLTLGFGWVRKNRLQVDVSGNWWQGGHELTTSFIWRKK